MDPLIHEVKPSKVFKWIKFLIYLFLVLCVILGGIYLLVQRKYQEKIFIVDEVEKKEVAVVFGAGLKFKNWPGDFLKDRILVAMELYQEGKVEKILMSGDSADLTHDEVKAMVNFAVSHGLDNEDLILDPKGLSTYDTCDRVKNVFEISDAILVTQRAHLGRAVYVCNQLGVDAFGVPSDLSVYPKMWKFRVREFFASIDAWWRVR